MLFVQILNPSFHSTRTIRCILSTVVFLLPEGLDSGRQVKSLRKTTTVLIFENMFRQLKMTEELSKHIFKNQYCCRFS